MAMLKNKVEFIFLGLILRYFICPLCALLPYIIKSGKYVVVITSREKSKHLLGLLAHRKCIVKTLFIKNGIGIIEASEIIDLVNFRYPSKCVYLNMTDQITLFLPRLNALGIEYNHPEYFLEKITVNNVKYSFKDRVFVFPGNPINVRLSLFALSLFLDVLKLHNLRPQISFGTLLGLVRNGNLINWDTDVDLVLSMEHKDQIYNQIVYLDSYGFAIARMHPDMFTFSFQGQYIDIYFLDRKSDGFYWRDTLYYDFKSFDNLEEKYFVSIGKSFEIPMYAHKLLTMWYGDWHNEINYLERHE